MTGTPPRYDNGDPHEGTGHPDDAHGPAVQGENGNAPGAAPYGTHDPYAQPYGQHVPRSWGGGEYDADATAFVQLPAGGLPDEIPLAAPGTGQGGYTPPTFDPSGQAPGPDPASTRASSPSRVARHSSQTASAVSIRGVTPTGAGIPESVSCRTSCAPCASSHRSAARWSALPAPPSGYGETVHSSRTTAAITPRPTPAAHAPPTSHPLVRGRCRRVPRRADNIGPRCVNWLTSSCCQEHPFCPSSRRIIVVSPKLGVMHLSFSFMALR